MLRTLSPLSRGTSDFSRSRLDFRGWIAARVIESTPRPCVYVLPPRTTTYRRHEPPFAAEQYARPPRRRVITLNHVPRRTQGEGEKKGGRDGEMEGKGNRERERERAS